MFHSSLQIEKCLNPNSFKERFIRDAVPESLVRMRSPVQIWLAAPKKNGYHLVSVLFCLLRRIWRSKCRCPGDICWPGRAPATPYDVPGTGTSATNLASSSRGCRSVFKFWPQEIWWVLLHRRKQSERLDFRSIKITLEVYFRILYNELDSVTFVSC